MNSTELHCSQGLSDWVVAGISPGIMSIKIFNFIIISLVTPHSQISFSGSQWKLLEAPSPHSSGQQGQSILGSDWRRARCPWLPIGRTDHNSPSCWSVLATHYLPATSPTVSPDSPNAKIFLKRKSKNQPSWPFQSKKNVTFPPS